MADYGAVRLRRTRSVVWICVAVAVLGLAAGLLVNFLHHRHNAVAKARDWAIEGPPCPELTAAAYQAQVYRAKRLFAYDDITFARFAGHVECDEVNDRGGEGLSVIPSCQFTSPTIVVVTPQAGRPAIYAPGPGKPATVTVRKGQPRCVLAANFQG